MTSDSVDDLARLWRGADMVTDRETETILMLIREKGRAFDELREMRATGELAVAFLLMCLTAFASYRTSWPWVRAGYGLCAVSFLVGGFVVVLYQKRRKAMPSHDMETSRYHEQLSWQYDREIAFLRTVKWWYGTPLLLGIALVGLGIYVRTGKFWEAIFIGVVVPVIGWVAFWYGHDVKGVGAIREKKRQLDVLAEAVYRT